MTDVVYFATLFVIAGTFVLVFSMRYMASREDARAKTSKEEAYREISTRAAAAQGATADRLASVQTELSAVSTRLAAIEKLLKDVG